jgi:hypothetical protein
MSTDDFAHQLLDKYLQRNEDYCLIKELFIESGKNVNTLDHLLVKYTPESGPPFEKLKRLLKEFGPCDKNKSDEWIKDIVKRRCSIFEEEEEEESQSQTPTEI